MPLRLVDSIIETGDREKGPDPEGRQLGAVQAGAEWPAAEGRADSGAGGGVEDLAEVGEVNRQGAGLRRLWPSAGWGPAELAEGDGGESVTRGLMGAFQSVGRLA